MKAICRLAGLLNVHIIYLQNATSPRMLSQHLIKLSTWVIKHGLHRRGTTELFAALMVMDENGDLRMSERGWEVVRMLSVAKALSYDVLNEVGDLLFECLTPSDRSTDMGDGVADGGTKTWRFEFMRASVRQELCGDIASDHSGLVEDVTERSS